MPQRLDTHWQRCYSRPCNSTFSDDLPRDFVVSSNTASSIKLPSKSIMTYSFNMTETGTHGMCHFNTSPELDWDIATCNTKHSLNTSSRPKTGSSWHYHPMYSAVNVYHFISFWGGSDVHGPCKIVRRCAHQRGSAFETGQIPECPGLDHWSFKHNNYPLTITRPTQLLPVGWSP